MGRYALIFILIFFTLGFTDIEIVKDFTLREPIDKKQITSLNLYLDRIALSNNQGIATFKPSTEQIIDAVGDSISANATMVVLNPDGNYTLTSAPTISDGNTGQIIIITLGNSEANTVELQDQDTLASSNLQLGDTSRTLGAKDNLVLIFDGTDWLEISFANN